MKISIVIPAFNVEEYLEGAVESVLATNYTDLEILIVEDGSQDNTLTVAKAIQGRDPERIKIFRHGFGRNRGAGASRNVGIQHASGDLVSFLDADDWYFPNRFDRCARIFNEHPEIDGVYESVAPNKFYRPSAELSNGQKLSGRAGNERLDVVHVELALSAPWNTNSITFRRRAFKKMGLFNELLEIGQDAELWIRASALTKIVAGDQGSPVCVYNRHDKNRYTDSFEQDPRNRLFLWLSAYKAIRVRDKNNEGLSALKKAIYARMVYKSDRLRRERRHYEAFKLLNWFVGRMPTALLCNRLVKEYVFVMFGLCRLVTISEGAK